ncbi:hypothetical protein D3C80_1825660 [compost metagenome]
MTSSSLPVAPSPNALRMARIWPSSAELSPERRVGMSRLGQCLAMGMASNLRTSPRTASYSATWGLSCLT